MDHSSPDLGEQEEGCSSSESGWTKYLVSPIDSEGGGGGGTVVDFPSDGSGGSSRGKVGGEADNDSLASDASSGPRRRRQQNKTDGGGGGSKAEGEEGGGRSGLEQSCREGSDYTIAGHKVPAEKAKDSKTRGGAARGFICFGKKMLRKKK